MRGKLRGEAQQRRTTHSHLHRAPTNFPVGCSGIKVNIGTRSSAERGEAQRCSAPTHPAFEDVALPEVSASPQPDGRG